MDGIVRRRELELLKESSAPYITASVGDYINTPIPYSTSVTIDIVGYIPHIRQSSTYIYYVTWGGTSTGLLWKTGAQAQWYLASGYNGVTLNWKTTTAVKVQWTGSTKTLQIEYTDGTTQSGSTTAQGSAGQGNNLRVRFPEVNLYYQRITSTVNGVVTYNLIAAKDNNGVACLYDTINDNYYYSANGTATLQTQIP